VLDILTTDYSTTVSDYSATVTDYSATKVKLMLGPRGLPSPNVQIAR
jgi:hypothetical protein